MTFPNSFEVEGEAKPLKKGLFFDLSGVLEFSHVARPQAYGLGQEYSLVFFFLWIRPWAHGLG